MENVKRVQLGFLIDKDKRSKFKYLCETQKNSSMEEVLNNFIDHFIKKNYPKHDIAEYAN